MGRKGTGRGEYTACDRCGESISKIYLRTHQKTVACEVAAKKASLTARNMREVDSSDLSYRLAQHVLHSLNGPPLIEQHVTEFIPPRFKRPSEQKKTFWVPMWLATVFESEYQLTENLPEYIRLYGGLALRAAREPDYLDELMSIFTLGGTKAVRALVESAKDRAFRLRAEAAALRTRAEVLEAKARAELGEGS